MLTKALVKERPHSSPGEGRGRYLVDDGAQLEAEVLAELAQVGEAAGPQGTVGIPGPPQEGADQRLPVPEHHVPCEGGQSSVSPPWKGPGFLLKPCLHREQMG